MRYVVYITKCSAYLTISELYTVNVNVAGCTLEHRENDFGIIFQFIMSQYYKPPGVRENLFLPPSRSRMFCPKPYYCKNIIQRKQANSHSNVL